MTTQNRCEQCKQPIADAPQFWTPPGQRGTVKGFICEVCCPHRSRYEFNDGKREYLNDICSDGCGKHLGKEVPVWVEPACCPKEPRCEDEDGPPTTTLNCTGCNMTKCHGDTQTHGHPSDPEEKCCEKQFVYSGGEGTSHYCCPIHCCQPASPEPRTTMEERYDKECNNCDYIRSGWKRFADWQTALLLKFIRQELTRTESQADQRGFERGVRASLEAVKLRLHRTLKIRDNVDINNICLDAISALLTQGKE